MEKINRIIEKYGAAGLLLFTIIFIINFVLIFLKSVIFLFITLISVFVYVALLGSVDEQSSENIYRIDKIEKFFQESKRNNKPKYIMYEFSIIVLLHSSINFYASIYLTSLLNRHNYEGYLLMFYVEWVILLLLGFIITVFFHTFISYDLRSNYIFATRYNYLIRFWNFVYFRKKVYESDTKKIMPIKIWWDNKKLSKQNLRSYIREELKSFDKVFLNKLQDNIEFPLNSLGNPIVSMTEIIKYGIGFINFFGAFGIGMYFGDTSKPATSGFIFSLGVLGFFLFIISMWIYNCITNQNLVNQLKVILPSLVSEELELRNSKRKIKRPHRYKNIV